MEQQQDKPRPQLSSGDSGHEEGTHRGTEGPEREELAVSDPLSSPLEGVLRRRSKNLQHGGGGLGGSDELGTPSESD